MHMFSVEKGFYGGHGIVGAQVPLGTGPRLRQPSTAATTTSRLTYFGDGAANQGQVYESFNMAKLWKLPVDLHHREQPVRHGHVGRARVGAAPTCRSAALSFDIPGEQVDGMDVRAVKAAGDKAVAVVPRGQGPYHPRDADLPLSRPLDVGPGEVPHPRGGREGAHRARSDRAGAPARCLQKKWASEDELKKIDAEVREIVNEAAEFATNDPEPDPSELYTDIYA